MSSQKFQQENQGNLVYSGPKGQKNQNQTLIDSDGITSISSLTNQISSIASTGDSNVLRASQINYSSLIANSSSYNTTQNQSNFSSVVGTSSVMTNFNNSSTVIKPSVDENKGNMTSRNQKSNVKQNVNFSLENDAIPKNINTGSTTNQNLLKNIQNFQNNSQINQSGISMNSQVIVDLSKKNFFYQRNFQKGYLQSKDQNEVIEFDNFQFTDQFDVQMKNENNLKLVNSSSSKFNNPSATKFLEGSQTDRVQSGVQSSSAHNNNLYEYHQQLQLPKSYSNENMLAIQNKPQNQMTKVFSTSNIRKGIGLVDDIVNQIDINQVQKENQINWKEMYEQLHERFEAQMIFYEQREKQFESQIDTLITENTKLLFDKRNNRDLSTRKTSVNEANDINENQGFKDVPNAMTSFLPSNQFSNSQSNKFSIAFPFEKPKFESQNNMFNRESVQGREGLLGGVGQINHNETSNQSILGANSILYKSGIRENRIYSNFDSTFNNSSIMANNFESNLLPASLWTQRDNQRIQFPPVASGINTCTSPTGQFNVIPRKREYSEGGNRIPSGDPTPNMNLLKGFEEKINDFLLDNSILKQKNDTIVRNLQIKSQQLLDAISRNAVLEQQNIETKHQIHLTIEEKIQIRDELSLLQNKFLEMQATFNLNKRDNDHLSNLLQFQIMEINTLNKKFQDLNNYCTAVLRAIHSCYNIPDLVARVAQLSKEFDTQNLDLNQRLSKNQEEFEDQSNFQIDKENFMKLEEELPQIMKAKHTLDIVLQTLQQISQSGKNTNRNKQNQINSSRYFSQQRHAQQVHQIPLSEINYYQSPKNYENRDYSMIKHNNSNENSIKDNNNRSSKLTNVSQVTDFNMKIKKELD